MQRGKHVYAEMDERHLTHPANAQDGGVPGSHRWIRDSTAQQQIADIEEKEEQSERQPCVPGPPRAPDGLPPDGTSRQDDGAEDCAHLCRGGGKPIEPRVLRKEVEEDRKSTRLNSSHLVI